MSAPTIHLGYELGSGKPVAVPLRHLAVTGQTQESGKTTTLEALVQRSGTTALTFITKRGERSFDTGRRVKPYFRDRADWQFVTSILDATLQEKNKFLRPWIMKICRATRTLAEVQERVREALSTARGINEGVYTQLDAYLDLIVPEIERADLAERLDLKPGLNVMDVIGFPMPMQMLFIQSALDWVNEHCHNTTVVIPEAWEFVPEGKGSPVKASAITLVRKGAGIGNHIWVDSQDMAGVDKVILRGCTVWLIGVQREANELKRNLASIPAGIQRPSASAIAMLERGQFFACFGKTTVKVYVQPAWMSEEQAAAIAKGTADIDSVPRPTRQQREDEVDRAEADALLAENARLKTQAGDAEQRGFERGMEAGLRQAGEYWNAAALDVRDHARKVTNLAEHLAEVARDGRWSVPRGLAKPAARAQETRDVVEDYSRADAPLAESPSANQRAPKQAAAEEAPAGPPSHAAMEMLGALVRSHPQAMTAELWGAATGKSHVSGTWYGAIKSLRAAGYVQSSGARFLATSAGIAASDAAPANPRDEIELFVLWREEIARAVGSGPMEMLAVLNQHRRRVTSEQWGLLAQKSSKSGTWYTAMKPLRAWGLIEGSERIAITEKGCALFEHAAARTDTAEVLRHARRAGLSGMAQRLYDALEGEMTREALASALRVSSKSGTWYGAVKELLASGLAEESAGNLRRVEERLADVTEREAAA